MSQKNNVFFFSPGGYGPHCRLDLWAETMEVDAEEGTEEYAEILDEMASDYIVTSDVDYGCYFITRDRAEQIVKELQVLLEEK